MGNAGAFLSLGGDLCNILMSIVVGLSQRNDPLL